MKNSILEQKNVAEQGVDYMERAVQVKRHPVWWISFEKCKISFVRKFLVPWDQGRLPSSFPARSIAHFHKILIKVGQTVGDRMLF